MEESNLTNELAEIDGRIKFLKENIEIGEAIERLHNNEDFKLVILKGYFDREAERIFGVLTDPNEYKRDMLQNMNEKLGSIRNLKQYIGVQLRNADMAPSEIEEEESHRLKVTESNVIDVKE